MPKHLVRAADLSDGDALRIRHPFNSASELTMTRLSDRTGLERIGVNLARIPPGKEAFVPHAHTTQEEWVYVLSGKGRVLIGEQEHEVGPGDFMGYPCDGTPHHMRNIGDEDLVVLQGGERRAGDIGRFPTLGKVGFALGEGAMTLVDEEHLETLPFSAWMKDEE